MIIAASWRSGSAGSGAWIDPVAQTAALGRLHAGTTNEGHRTHPRNSVWMYHIYPRGSIDSSPYWPPGAAAPTGMVSARWKGSWGRLTCRHHCNTSPATAIVRPAPHSVPTPSTFVHPRDSAIRWWSNPHVSLPSYGAITS